MQLLASHSHAPSAYPSKMKALDRDALAAMHGGGFERTVAEANTPGNITKSSDDYAAIAHKATPLAPAPSSTPMSISNVAEPALSIASGFLMGGPVGALTAAASELFEIISGDSVIGHVASLLTEAPLTTTNLSSLSTANRAYLQAGELIRK